MSISFIVRQAVDCISLKSARCISCNSRSLAAIWDQMGAKFGASCRGQFTILSTSTVLFVSYLEVAYDFFVWHAASSHVERTNCSRQLIFFKK